MDKETVYACKNCGIIWSGSVGTINQCPKCISETVPVQRNLPKMVSDKDIEGYIDGVIEGCDGYVKSSIPCFRCDGGHYMVWPGVRDNDDYKKVTPKLRLPQCPKRVWEKADPKGLGMPLSEFIRSLEI